MHLDMILAQIFLITSLHRFLQPHRAPSGCMAGPALGVADLGGCDRRLVGQGHQQGQQEVPSHPPRSTLRGLARIALRCIVRSGAWVVGRRKHMCHTAYLPHSIFATHGGDMVQACSSKWVIVGRSSRPIECRRSCAGNGGDIMTVGMWWSELGPRK